MDGLLPLDIAVSISFLRRHQIFEVCVHKNTVQKQTGMQSQKCEFSFQIPYLISNALAKAVRLINSIKCAFT